MRSASLVAKSWRPLAGELLWRTVRLLTVRQIVGLVHMAGLCPHRTSNLVIDGADMFAIDVAAKLWGITTVEVSLFTSSIAALFRMPSMAGECFFLHR